MISTRLLAWIIALSCIPSACALNSWDTPSAEFAKQIAALTGPGTITLTITNRSSLSNDDVGEIRRDRRTRVAIRRAQRARQRRQFGCSRHALAEPAGRPVGSRSAGRFGDESGDVPGRRIHSGRRCDHRHPRSRLHVNLLFPRPIPILDLAILAAGNDQRMVVSVRRPYQDLQPDCRKLANSADLRNTHASPFPRDLRGRIVPASDHPFDAYLPGVVCTATKNGDGWDLTLTAGTAMIPGH